MNCERCGRNVPFRSKVCPNCGKANPNYREPEQETYTPPVQRPVNNVYTQSGYKQPANNQHHTQTTTTTTTAAPAKKFSFKTFVLLAVAVIVLIIVVKNGGGNRLKGTWVAADGSSITFASEDSGYLTAETATYNDAKIDFTYFIDDDIVEINTEATMYSYSQVVRFRFSVSGDQLTLTELDYGTSEVFYKR